MADPKFHDFKDMLNKNQVNLNYDELLARHKQKKIDFERTKADIENNDANLEKYIAIPRHELALVEHYSSIPEVEIAPEVKELWETQSDELAKVQEKMETPKAEHLRAYESWQDLVEQMDEKRRSDLGLNGDWNYKEANAKEGIKEAKEKVKSAEKAKSDVEYEVDPIKAAIGFFTGNDPKSILKKQEARKALSDANKNLSKAKRHLAEIQEQRAHLAESRDKLTVKEYAVLEKLADAKEMMAEHQLTAEQISNRPELKTIQEALHKQYELIDKYKSIQSFKNSSQYASIYSYLKINDKSLAESLSGIPDNLSAKSFKVTLTGPLQLPSQAQKIEDTTKKIEELMGRPLDLTKLDEEKQKLSDEKTQLNIDKDDKQTEIDGHNKTIASHEKTISDLEESKKRATIKETDTKDTIQAEMDQIADKNSQEYKELKMKQDHLILQEQYNKAVEEIKTLKEFILANKDTLKPDDLQKKLQELQNKQSILKLSEEQLRTDEYSKNLAGIDSEISDEKTEIKNIKAEITKVQEEIKKIENQIKKIEEIAKLIEQRGELQQEDKSIQEIENLSEQLNTSTTKIGVGSLITVAAFYMPLLYQIKSLREKAVLRIEQSRGKPLEDPTQEQGEEGR